MPAMTDHYVDPDQNRSVLPPASAAVDLQQERAIRREEATKHVLEEAHASATASPTTATATQANSQPSSITSTTHTPGSTHPSGQTQFPGKETGLPSHLSPSKPRNDADNASTTALYHVDAASKPLSGQAQAQTQSSALESHPKSTVERVLAVAAHSHSDSAPTTHQGQNTYQSQQPHLQKEGMTDHSLVESTPSRTVEDILAAAHLSDAHPHPSNHSQGNGLVQVQGDGSMAYPDSLQRNHNPTQPAADQRAAVDQITSPESYVQTQRAPQALDGSLNNQSFREGADLASYEAGGTAVYPDSLTRAHNTVQPVANQHAALDQARQMNASSAADAQPERFYTPDADLPSYPNTTTQTSSSGPSGSFGAALQSAHNPLVTPVHSAGLQVRQENDYPTPAHSGTNSAKISNFDELEVAAGAEPATPSHQHYGNAYIEK